MPSAAKPWTLVLVVSAFAGCLSNEPAPVPTETPKVEMGQDAIYAEIQALMTGVPCDAPVEPTRTSGNLKLLSKLTFTDEGGGEHGSRELDIRGNLALTTLSGTGGIGVFDIRDPLQPIQLSVVPRVGELDVKFSPDNLTAIAGGLDGISLINIVDPENPGKPVRWSWSEAPFPPRDMPLQNAHMLYSARIAGQDWVFLAPNSNTGIWILKLEGTPESRKLTYVTQTLPVQGGPLGPHDMTVQYDTDLKMWIMYSADGYHGWTAWNVNDPSKPTLAGGIVKPETGYTHTIQAAKVGNRRLVATIQEVGVNAMEVYDATNLQAPVLLGVWQESPGSPAAQHNFNIVAGRLYMAHYARGMFVFDLNKLGTAPGPIAPVAHFGDGAPADRPLSVYDVVLKDGIVYVASSGGGLMGIFALGDGCVPVGKPELTSIG